jgi:hypothetical protein
VANGVFSIAHACGFSASQNLLVVVGTGANWGAWSSDGTTFTGLGNGNPFVTAEAVAFGAVGWVAVGDGAVKVAVSADGKTWLPLGDPASFATAGFAVAFGGNSMWVIGGNAGANTLASGQVPPAFTLLGKSLFSGVVQGIAWSQTLGLFVATGAWQLQNFPVFWRFFRLGRSGTTIAWSTDGITFTPAAGQSAIGYGFAVGQRSGPPPVTTPPGATTAPGATTTPTNGATTATQGGSLLPVIIGAVIGVLLLAGVVMVVAVVCYKRRQALNPYGKMSDYGDAEYNFMVTDSVSDLSTPTMVNDLPPPPQSSLPNKFILWRQCSQDDSLFLAEINPIAWSKKVREFDESAERILGRPIARQHDPH